VWKKGILYRSHQQQCLNWKSFEISLTLPDISPGGNFDKLASKIEKATREVIRRATPGLANK